MKKRSVDRIMGVSAIMISLLTLLMFIYQTNIMHTQSRLSVMPRLGFSTSFNHSDSIIYFSTSIKNKGIGPAIINAVKISHDKTEYNLDFYDFFMKVFPKVEDFGEFKKFSNIVDGSTLAANESKVLFAFEFDEEKMEDLYGYLKIGEEEELPFDIQIDYSSIYDEEWRIDINRGGHPIKIK